MRNKLVNIDEKKVLIAQLGDSKESQDNYTLINCHGYGRIRIYRNFTIHATHSDLETRKPLFRGHPPVKEMQTQVFQLAGCNWRCWYCFVDFNLLSGNPKYGKFFSAEEMLNMYLEQENPPQIFDLSGSQPDLVPEWCLWMMQAIEKRGL
jgi:pyruvate-formate lyase-activating enzyme